MSIALAGSGVEITAVMWPPCECGKPYPAHAPVGCPGYRPSRPVEYLGTRAYSPPASWPLGKRILAALIWRVEVKLQGWRERLGRRPSRING